MPAYPAPGSSSRPVQAKAGNHELRRGRWL